MILISALLYPEVGLLAHIGLGNNLLDVTPKSQETKANTDKWDYITAGEGMGQFFRNAPSL